MDFASLFNQSPEGKARILAVKGKKGGDTKKYLLTNKHLELTIEPAEEANESKL